ncbi:MAG: L,D-transpeptidase family protein [Candidatus Competibacter sp.]
MHKAERELLLVAGEKTLKRYRIALGGHPQGHKTQEGDRRTPEGVYRIAGRNPRSAYHLSLRISYPNEDDRIQAASRGVSPGGDIMIHGLPNGFGWIGRLHRWADWTAGCIAVTDSEIEEIWRSVPDGRRSRLNRALLGKCHDARWRAEPPSVRYTHLRFPVSGRPDNSTAGGL